MYFVEPNALNRTGLTVGQDRGLAHKLSLGLLEFAEDRARAFLRGWHDGVPQIERTEVGGLSLKEVEVMISARQSYVGGTASDAMGHAGWRKRAARDLGPMSSAPSRTREISAFQALKGTRFEEGGR
jgi:hypothetical protein